MFSLIIPVYRNEASLPALLQRLEDLHRRMPGDLEAVFVVDGSPDRCAELLLAQLPKVTFLSQLLILSRNFGAFSAIAAGLASARGSLLATMAADLQEPLELIDRIRDELETGQYDVVIGRRGKREDPFLSRMLSKTFWKLYRMTVQREVPADGVDVFGCTSEFREHVLELSERNTTLVGLIFWLGFRRGEVIYHREQRRHGKTAWSFARRTRYLLDSIFAFSDLPIRMLSLMGMFGLMLSLVLAAIVLFARWSGKIAVPGYSATALLILFFGGLNSLGLGVIGEYVWRTFENTKRRPGFIVAKKLEFEGARKLHE